MCLKEQRKPVERVVSLCRSARNGATAPPGMAQLLRPRPLRRSCALRRRSPASKVAFKLRADARSSPVQEDALVALGNPEQ